jgi:hypothetical protein
MNIIRNLTDNKIPPSGLRSKETDDKIDYEYEIFLGGAINLQLINKINEFSIIFYQRRLEYIHTILNTSFIQYQQSQSYVKYSVNENNTKINAIIKNNIQKCLEWISKYHKTIHNNLSTEMNTIVLHHLNDITSRIDL